MSAKVTGMSSKTVRNWTTEFLEINQLCPIDTEIINDVMFSARGNHAKTISLFTSVEFQREAREYVRTHANRKGSPNMTCKSFAAWVADTWDHEVHEETARQWLHRLGFKPKSTGKGVYFDGHE